MMRAPCTGPCTAMASRLWCRSSSASPAAAAGLCARNATVGPEPETIPAIAPQDSPQPEGVAQARGQFDRGALEVVDQHPAQGVGVAAAQRL